jgi:hypothetical protein
MIAASRAAVERRAACSTLPGAFKKMLACFAMLGLTDASGMWPLTHA